MALTNNEIAMSPKWDERSVTIFLNAYEKHPCLWNPYDKDYYHCVIKNAAWQRIIASLNIPGLTATDYLHQIKIIKEKYRKEQMRMIEGLQSRNEYSSPFPWYNIVADMLAKVIRDEERAKSEIILENSICLRTPTIKSKSTNNVRKAKRKEKPLLHKNLKISPCTYVSCKDIGKRTKLVVNDQIHTSKHNVREGYKKNENKSNSQLKYPSCLCMKLKENILERNLERLELFNYVPTKDTGLGGTGCPMFPCTSVDSKPDILVRNGANVSNSPFQCPLCGWEDLNNEKIKINAEKPLHEGMPVLLKNEIPCSDHSNFNHGKYNQGYSKNKYEPPRKYRDMTNKKEVPCLNTMKTTGEMSIDPYPRPDFSPTKSNSQLNLKKSIDEEVQCNKSFKESASIACNGSTCTLGKAQIFASSLKLASKFEFGVIKACTQLRIVPSKANKDLKTCTITADKLSQTIEVMEQAEPVSEIKQFTKETQLYETKTAACINSVKYADEEIQATCCVSNKTTCVQNLKYSISLQTLDPHDENIAALPNKKMKKDYCVQKSIVPLKVNKATVITLEQADKETQSTICMSRANLFHCPSFNDITANEMHTILPVRKVQSTVSLDSRNLKEVTRYDKDFILLTPYGKYVSLVRDKSQEFMKPCVNENLNQCLEKNEPPFNSPCTKETCSPNLFEKRNEDSIMTRIVQQFFDRILLLKNECRTVGGKLPLSKENNTEHAHEHRCNVKGHYTIDITDVVNKIKEFTGNLSKNQSEKELSQKSAVTSMHSSNIDTKLDYAEVQTSHDDVCVAAVLEENIPKPIFESTIIENKEQQTFEGENDLQEKEAGKSFVEDKEVSTHSEYRDIGTNRSLSKLPVRNVGIQGSHELLYNSVSTATHEIKQKKINRGTQKRDPILVRVIKCNSGQDKATITSEFITGMEKKCTDKNVETYCRLNCASYNTHRKYPAANYPNEENLTAASKETRKKEILEDDYAQRLISRKYKCDKDCKGRTFRNRDLTDVTNIDPVYMYGSKIPLCLKAHKCTRRGNI